MKVKLNPMFEQVSGQLGDLVFRELRGETIAGRKPSISGEPTESQVEQRERFKQAAAYGKSVMANSSLRALYEEAAKSKNIPVFALTVADFLNEPTIESVDMAGYTGKIGDLIRIATSDDFGVVKVQINILNVDGVKVETGQAVETASGSGRWVYTAVSSFAVDSELNVQIVATDRPGGSATVSQPITVG